MKLNTKKAIRILTKSGLYADSDARLVLYMCDTREKLMHKALFHFYCLRGKAGLMNAMTPYGVKRNKELIRVCVALAKQMKVVKVPIPE